MKELSMWDVSLQVLARAVLRAKINADPQFIESIALSVEDGSYSNTKALKFVIQHESEILDALEQMEREAKHSNPEN